MTLGDRDHHDLVFPGNLKEIMNQVLETERRAEAKLIEARKDAESLRIKAEAEQEADFRRLDAEKQRVKLTSEAEAEKLRLALQSQVDEAKALAEHPELVRLKQLETLREMARSGAKFVWGIESDPLSGAFSRDK
jgi:regulator of protease activity HflC (stomatin/prohibitin superfamily)